jgi:hypothetical protein
MKRGGGYRENNINSIEIVVNSFLNKHKHTISNHLSKFKKSDGNIDTQSLISSIPNVLQQIVSHYQQSNYIAFPHYNQKHSTTFTGGAREKRRKINDNIHKTTKRVLKSISRFKGKSRKLKHL